MNDYEKDMRIDESALDIELLEQPQLMMKYTKIEAQAEKELAVKKEDLDILISELDQQIRQSPEDYDLEKVTEKALMSIIHSDDSYKAANAEVIDANYHLKMARGAVRAVDARKQSLQDLVKLHGQQYFAGPSVPRDITAEALKRTEQRSSNRTVRMQKKRKVKRT